ncbi:MULTISPECIES: TraE/TraK family type IV conjugative transfer system protein [unclassified Helicobacter]|uniref:TraE/TraK family type IV conjugative transfer system protein n=1 Tax=unclassified Helicobacter TaxID=2593540 RepID=UPI0015F1356B|nr:MULTISPECIES: TraE/TraK family type IV conjugative transfer system protein [unclassified Helicobacter]
MSLEINEYGPMGKDAINEVDKLLLNNRLLQLIMGGLLLVLLILSYGYFKLANDKKVTVIMPPYGDFEVAKMKADPLYYRVFADYVLTNMASFNTSTIKDKLVRAGAVFDRETYLLKKSEFDNYYKSIMTNKIEQEYQYDENQVDVVLDNGGSTATVTYKGFAIQKIANLTKITKQCNYTFGFFISDGRIFQDSAYTNCLNNESLKELTKEEKKAIDEDREDIVRRSQQPQSDKNIDNKIIERETLNKEVQKQADFENEIRSKKKEKLIDREALLNQIHKNEAQGTPNSTQPIQSENKPQSVSKNNDLQDTQENAKIQNANNDVATSQNTAQPIEQTPNEEATIE